MNLIPKKIVGLDFHDYFAQAVEVKATGKKVVLNSFSRVPIPPNVIKDGEIMDKVELKKILSSFLETANPSPIKTTKVACSFPSKKVFTHVFSLPASLNEKEIAKALPFEAETVIPFSMSDVYWDFRIIQKDEVLKKHAAQKILFACVPKVVADSYVELLESMGLSPVAFTIPAECAEYGLKNQLIANHTSLVIDIGSLVTSYSLFRKDSLVKAYSSLQGGRTLISNLAKNYQTNEAAILEQKERGCLDKVYWPEIEKFVRATLADAADFVRGNKVSDVFITGEFLNLPDFYESARKFFPNQKVSFGDPRIGVSIESDKFLPLDKKDGFVPYSIYFTRAFGLAFKGIDPDFNKGINLLPDRLRDSFASKKLSLGVGIGAVAITLLSLGIATFMTLKHQESVYNRLSIEGEKKSLQQLIFGTRYQEIKDAITDFNNEVSSLVSIQNALFSVPTLINEVTDTIPKGVQISSLNFNDLDLSLEISGVAEDRNTLLQVQNALEQAPFVEELIAPRSNFDEKTDISFYLKLKLNFTELDQYGQSD